MLSKNLKYIIWFIVFVSLQILLFNRMHSIPFVNIFVYVLFLILLPFEISAVWYMLLAFCTGLIIDAFSNTLGIHAAASVLLAYMRPAVLRLYSPRDGYEKNTLPDIRHYGFLWFLKYSLLLIFCHHLALFILDAFSFYNFHLTLLRTILSSIASISVILLIQFLTLRPK
ncbi:MAG: rod shape-determining protein MreD [Bacteroidales bacterium]|nr:rod shape-determining protein MreD [Bacteroidales bacterium]